MPGAVVSVEERRTRPRLLDREARPGVDPTFDDPLRVVLRAQHPMGVDAVGVGEHQDVSDNAGMLGAQPGHGEFALGEFLQN
jgi:hypothetical protein